MRVRLAGIGTFADPQRLDALGDNHRGYFFDVLEELLEPALEVETVPQDEIGRLRPHDIEWRGLIVVDLCTRLSDRLDDRPVSGHVLRNVLNDGESRHHTKRLARGAL